MKSKRAREAVEPEEKDPQVDVPAKKRKRGGEDEEKDADTGFVVDVKKPKKEKKDKKDKKDKKKDKKESRKDKKEKRKDLLDLPEEVDEEEAVTASEPAEAETPAKTNGVATEEKSKKKKEKKEKAKEAKKAAKEAAKAADDAAPKAETTSKTDEQTPAATGDDAIDLDSSAAAKTDRHIVFVGNLPFTATAATISAHFASLSPIAVRCLRDKGEDAKPCRGIAFVEFGRVWHQRTCLDKFHHSEFNDGISPPRKINVELTAGGGGKTKQRQDKIRDKNKKLEENRAKRIEKEKAAPKTNGAAKPQEQHNMQDAIHPSRRAMVPGRGL